MKLNLMTRPSAPLAACAPSASALLISAPAAVTLAERAPVSQAHQVHTQAELGWTIGGAYAANGTTAFAGSNGFVGSSSIAVKRMADARGVPPRGRPV